MKKVYQLVAATGAVLLVASGCASPERIVQAPVDTVLASSETMAEETKAVHLAERIAQTEGIQLAEGTIQIDDQAVPLAGGAMRVPTASGTVTYGNAKVTVDASNTKEGYVMIQYTGSVGKIKVQITKSGKDTYTYDLNARAAYEVFPLTEGSGTYSIKVFENVTGNQYSQALSQDISVSLASEFAPFLYPNQYVNFTTGSAVVSKGAEVAAGAADQVGVVTNVYNYVINNIKYDTALANSVKSGYLPNVDQVLAKKSGICFDYAAVMTAMLRSQNIPTKLVVGYTGDLYHAWVNVYIDGTGWVDNMIYFDGTNWKLMDPTFASSSGQSQDVMQYIGDNSNYKEKYAY